MYLNIYIWNTGITKLCNVNNIYYCYLFICTKQKHPNLFILILWTSVAFDLARYQISTSECQVYCRRKICQTFLNCKFRVTNAIPRNLRIRFWVVFDTIYLCEVYLTTLRERGLVTALRLPAVESCLVCVVFVSWVR